MKTYFVQKTSEGDTEAQVKAMRQAGFEFVELKEADVIYCASISVMNNALEAKKLTGKPLVVYCWDYYLWAHEKCTMSGDWRRYADLLKMADLIFVPSRAQQKRLKELLDLDSVVVLSGVTTYDKKPIDDGYILDPLREYPEENYGWAQRAASELNIPIITPNHQCTLTAYRHIVSRCRFIVSVYREASTGGLTLVEGLWLGKPCLISNSPYQGAKDYVGKFARTFQYDDYEDFKRVVKEMWNGPRLPDMLKARNFISKKLTYAHMALTMKEKIHDLLRVS
jgi:hypothetical protein